jgi:SSS family solute:Na+ symporter
MDWIAVSVFIALFLFVAWLGFAAAKWRAGDMDQLHEWGLGGRRFGTFVTWFLLGGDLYTAYTFIAVPALVYGAGALGFFAVPYTILIYPILYLIFPRLWAEGRRMGYVTAADFVRGRFDNRWLGLAVGLTGIVATMPYIALQLVGMQVVIGALGFPSTGIWSEVPLIIAFLVLALFTYSSGLRAPAMIAVVKDCLIYITVIAAIIVIPMQLGGFDKVFNLVDAKKVLLAAPPGNGVLGAYGAYATLALGSAMALFLYPHSFTAILSSSDSKVIRRNAAILPAYSLVLGFLALLGFMAIAMGVSALPEFADGFKTYKNNFAVPALFLHVFPGWFVGIAFAAIAIGALVPAAIMSIATANIYTRTIYREFINPNCTDAQEASMAKLASLVVKIGALVFIFTLDLPFALQLQLLGGVWMIQIAPSLVLPLYVKWLNGWALLIGWAAGTAVGTVLAYWANFTPMFTISIPGVLTSPVYHAISSLVVNLVVTLALSPVFNTMFGRDEPVPAKLGGPMGAH